MPQGKTYYIVRKQFISGMLAGLSFNDETAVPHFTPGQIYKSAAVAGERYVVISVTPVYPG